MPAKKLSQSDIERQAARDELIARSVRGSLLGWCTWAMAQEGRAPAEHHRYIIERLERVVTGECDRLIVCAPPGSAKSTYNSLLFPVHFLTRNPGSQIIGAAHTASLAENFSAKARKYIEEYQTELGFGVRDDTRSRERWQTTNGGEYRAVGVGGSPSGLRGDVVLIDDPVKSFADVQSLTNRNVTYDWYTNDIIPRLKPGGRIVITMTRWHVDDLAGRIMDREPGRWEVVRLPALAEEDDPLGRQIGAALWPSWETEAMIKDKEKTLGAANFQGLFQQRPTVQGGTLFRPAMIELATSIPDGTAVRAWDLASSLTGDWTVGAKILKTVSNRFVILDVVRFRGGPDQVEAKILETAAKDGTGVKISLPRDPGQAGKAQVAYLTRALAGYRVDSSPESGSKEVRSGPLASQVNIGSVSMVSGGWNRELLDEFETFPSGRNDDIVDACSRAFNDLLQKGVPTTFTRFPLFG